jgi:hypothetical protein
VTFGQQVEHRSGAFESSVPLDLHHFSGSVFSSLLYSLSLLLRCIYSLVLMSPYSSCPSLSSLFPPFSLIFYPLLPPLLSSHLLSLFLLPLHFPLLSPPLSSLSSSFLSKVASSLPPSLRASRSTCPPLSRAARQSSPYTFQQTQIERKK